MIEIGEAHRLWRELSGFQKFALLDIRAGRSRAVRRGTLARLAAEKLIFWIEDGPPPAVTGRGLFVINHRPRGA